MADDSSSPATGVPNLLKTEPTTPIPNPNSIPNPSPTPPPQQNPQPQVAALDPTTQTPVFQPYAPPSQIPGSLLPPPPPFRPGMQFAPNFQNPNSGVPPPGVNPGGVMAAPGSMPTYQPQPGQLPNQAGMRPFPTMANGYPGIHGVAPPPAS